LADAETAQAWIVPPHPGLIRGRTSYQPGSGMNRICCSTIARAPSHARF